MPGSTALGLNGIADYGASQPFIDVLKASREWQGRRPGVYISHTGDQLRVGGHLDANGHPFRVPSGDEVVGTIILCDLAAADTSLNGRYRLTFTGNGDLHIHGAQNITRGNGFAEFDYTASGGNLIALEITRFDAANPIKLRSCINLKHRAAFEAGEIFRPEWLALIKDFRLLRFMDWQATNNSPLSAWADRPKLSSATWTPGVPVEVMVALCNKLGVDGWFCIPHLATIEYITQFADYVRTNLRDGLTAYYEYSNEVWNFQFTQAQWANQQAEALWPDYIGQDGWMQFYGGRAAQMAMMIDGIYDGAPGYKKVITTHTGWQGLEDGILNAPRWVAMQAGRRAPKDYFDCYAVTGYFGHNLSYGNTAHVQAWRREGDAHAIDQMITALEGDIGALINTWRYQKGVADEAGLSLVMYEGGSHITPAHSALGADPTLFPFLEQFHYSDAMAALYTRAMTGFREIGGEFFNVFVEISRPGQSGFWGARRHLLDDNPRWRAVTAFNAGNAAPAEPAPVEPEEPEAPEPPVIPPVTPKTDAISTFTYQNSLFDHQAYGGADDDTRVPNWAQRMAAAAGLTYEATGSFGFATQWPLPPNASVGYENAPIPPGLPQWTQTWTGMSAINVLTFVPDNFDSFDRAPNVNSDNQWSPVGPGQNYRDRLLQIIDAWEANAPMPKGQKRRYCVYAGWADFGSRSAGGQWNSYSAAQLKAYLDWSAGAYHQWYVDLVAMLKAARPGLQIELLDVQRVMMETWRNTPLNTLTGSRLWEDNSPHGTETWYLLAAIVYYMEMFGAKPPANFNPLAGTGAGSGVDSVMIRNWSAIVDYAWDALGNSAATPPVVVAPEPADPKPTEPTPEPVDPAPVNPAPVDPTPVDPTPADPSPEPADPTPAPVDPAPPEVNPMPTRPEILLSLAAHLRSSAALVEQLTALEGAPTPIDPVPADPAPVDPAPVDPAPVDPTPAEPAPVPDVPIWTLSATPKLEIPTEIIVPPGTQDIYIPVAVDQCDWQSFMAYCNRLVNVNGGGINVGNGTQARERFGGLDVVYHWSPGDDPLHWIKISPRNSYSNGRAFQAAIRVKGLGDKQKGKGVTIRFVEGAEPQQITQPFHRPLRRLDLSEATRSNAFAPEAVKWSPNGRDADGNPCYMSALSHGRAQDGNEESGLYADESIEGAINPISYDPAERALRLHSTGYTTPVVYGKNTNGTDRLWNYQAAVLQGLHLNEVCGAEGVWRIEAKIPNRRYSWPAFWLVNRAWNESRKRWENRWPGEIDCLEKFNHAWGAADTPYTSSFAQHYGPLGDWTKKAGAMGNDFDVHQYGSPRVPLDEVYTSWAVHVRYDPADTTKSEVTFFVNDMEVGCQVLHARHQDMREHVQFYPIFNVAVKTPGSYSAERYNTDDGRGKTGDMWVRDMGYWPIGARLVSA